jgi:3-(methylthio)propionyl---CoA ligase
MTDKAHMPRADPQSAVLRRPDQRHSDAFEWPEFDERTASSLCYTSGTTGNPKGVLYSHRSTILHAYGARCPMRSTSRRATWSCRWCRCSMSTPGACRMPAPMDRAPSWCSRGAALDGASVYELFEAEKRDHVAGVPTVWLGCSTT